ncbi:hypothetical protein [Bradyrhizobium acaciae]|uniref:hypothetical protein n=1 Tax=Bradyrhizobium acaciae TaxID=2683706 RepID=UPI001E2A53ED|nr:hypothetical protein [Bradyrhizobium acaciae]MCC8977983.1 hypothetical protein [Bradyrhizobium acaciae]
MVKITVRLDDVVGANATLAAPQVAEAGLCTIYDRASPFPMRMDVVKAQASRGLDNPIKNDGISAPIRLRRMGRARRFSSNHDLAS